MLKDWQEPKPCIFCGKIFTPRRINQKTCRSRACEAKRKAANLQSTAPTEEIPCSECGKLFVPAQKNHATCSPECSKARSNRMARELRAKCRAAEKQGKDPKREILVNQFAEYVMEDPWPGLDFLPPGQTSWYSAQMMPLM